MPRHGRWDLWALLEARGRVPAPRVLRQTPDLRKLFVRTEESSLRLGERCDGKQECATVEGPNRAFGR